MSIIINSLGMPEPPSDIQRKLRRLHPRLHLRHIPHLGTPWAVCMDFEENNPRMKLVQEQKLDRSKAFDIIGYLPMECSVAEAPSYLRKILREYPVAEVQRVADSLDRWNHEDIAEAQVEEVMAELESTGYIEKPGVTGKRTKHKTAKPTD